jgi:hypothetical protein
MSASELPYFISSNEMLTAQSLAVSATSPAIETKESEWVTIQVIATGSAVAGSVQAQASCDGVDYSNIGTAMNLATTASQIQTLPQGAYSDVRLVFTAASGTGSLNAFINLKR